MVGRIRHMTPTVVCSSPRVLRLCGEWRGPESGCGRRVPTPTFRPYHHPGRAGSRAAEAVRPAQAPLPDAARPIEGRADTGRPGTGLPVGRPFRSRAPPHRPERRTGPARPGRPRPAHHAGHPVGRRERHAVRRCRDIVRQSGRHHHDRPCRGRQPSGLDEAVSPEPPRPSPWSARGCLRLLGFTRRSPTGKVPWRLRSARSGGRPDPEGDRIRRATRSGGRPDPNRRQRSTGCRQDSRTSRGSSVPGRSRNPHGAAVRKDLVSIALGSSRNRHPLFARMTALLE